MSTIAESENIEPELTTSDETEVGRAGTPVRPWHIINAVSAAVAASLFFLGVVGLGLERSAVLFVGLPTVIALVVVLMPAARTAVGVSLVATTLFLLVAALLFRVPIVGIVVAAPLIYLVALLLGLLIDRSRKRAHTDAITYALLLAPFAIMSIEGAVAGLSFDRGGIVTVESVVAASALDVEAALEGEPRFERDLPLLLSLGFPRPVSATGSGLSIGSQRRIRFEGAAGGPADLLLKVTIRRPGEARFEVVEDGSAIGNWLRWKRSTVNWMERAPGETVVRWQLEYDRLLDPSWYFSLWQQYGVVLAADYLIETLATPR